MSTLTINEPTVTEPTLPAHVADTVAPAATFAVVLNAEAGADGKETVQARLAELFAARGVAADIMLARSGEEIAEFARRAVEGPAQVVVAGGGDGTISTVASALVETDKVLGVLPVGTLNHFAKDLRLPLDLEAAVQVLVAGHTTQVDVGEVNGRIFINNSSLGLYPSIVRQREKQKRQGHNRWLAFLWAALVVFKRYPFMDVRLDVDGQELRRRTPFVFIGNNEYEMDTFNVGGRNCLDAGRLSLHVTHKPGRLRLVGLALRALFGRLRAAKDFDSLCAREIWIETRRRRLRVATDGEITIMWPPLHYRVRPGALKVIVPKKLSAISYQPSAKDNKLTADS